MNFQLILLDHRQKISLTIQPQFHCELPVRLSATQIVPQLQLSMRFKFWDITQHSKSDYCNIAQVLMYGCWTTSSELSGLSQADKVSLLQGVLKTQVQKV